MDREVCNFLNGHGVVVEWNVLIWPYRTFPGLSVWPWWINDDCIVFLHNSFGWSGGSSSGIAVRSRRAK